MKDLTINFTKFWDHVCIFAAALYLGTIMLFSYSLDTLYLANLAFLFLFGCVIVKVVLSKKVPYSKYYHLLLVYFAYMFVSTFWAFDVDVHIEKITTIVQITILSLCYFIIFANKDHVRKFIVIFIVAGYIMCLYSLNYYGGIRVFLSLMSSTRLGSEINQANVFGYLAALTVVFSFYEAFYNGHKYHYALLILPLLMSFSSGSRKAFLVVAMGLVMLTYLKDRTADFKKTAFYLILFVGAFYFAMQLPIFSVVTERFDALLNIFSETEKVDSSTALREKYIAQGWAYIIQKPFFGYGMAAFGELTQTGVYSHSNYIEVLVNGGIFGLLSVYMFKIYLMIRYIPRVLAYNHLTILFASLLAISIIYEVGAVTYYSKFQAIFLGIYFAVEYTEDKKRETIQHLPLKERKHEIWHTQ